MHGMSSWNDLRVSNPKCQETASSKDEARGASSLLFENEEKLFGSDELEYVVKDSQEEGSGFHPGGLQDSSDCVEKGVVGVLLKDSIQAHHGDEDGRYNWSPTLVVSSEQDTNKIQGISPCPKNGLLSFTNWDGKQSQPVSTRGSLASTPESLRKKTGDLPLAQQLQKTRERVDSDGRASKKFRNMELSSEPRGVPLALPLQELLQPSPATGPSTFLRQPQGKKGGRKRPNGGQTFASSTRTDLSAIEDDIVEDFDYSDEGIKGGRKRLDGGKKSASTTRTDLSAIEDDIVEDFDNSDEVQVLDPRALLGALYRKI